MVSVLKSKGYEALHCASLKDTKEIQEVGTFSLISCFNVLDRCDKPISLLKEFRKLMNEDSLLLLTVVFLSNRSLT
eukprot:UN05614